MVSTSCSGRVSGALETDVVPLLGQLFMLLKYTGTQLNTYVIYGMVEGVKRGVIPETEEVVEGAAVGEVTTEIGNMISNEKTAAENVPRQVSVGRTTSRTHKRFLQESIVVIDLHRIKYAKS